jgi:hypothetical protein
VAYAFGVLSPRERRDLHVLRRIRNDFAHAVDYDLAFTTPAVADPIKALSTPQLLEANPAFGSDDHRFRFYLAVGLLVLILSDFAYKAPHRRRARPRYSGEVTQYAWPNNPLELTAHSAGFLGIPGVLACGPSLTGGVRVRPLTAQEMVLSEHHTWTTG